MRTDRLCFAAAAAIGAQVAVLSSTAGAPAAVFNFVAFAAITLLLWIATDGKRPVLVVGAVMALGCAPITTMPWRAAAASTACASTRAISAMPTR